MRKIINRILARIVRDVTSEVVNQLDARMSVARAVDGLSPLPRLGGWAIDWTLCAAVIQELQIIPQPKVLEFGSGESSRLLAQIISQRGGQLVSVEHDASWCERINGMHSIDGTAQLARVLHVPLVKSAEHRVESYDEKALPHDFDWDVCLVDGPVGRPGHLVRLVPSKFAVQGLVARAGRKVFLDDLHRAEEVQILRQLTQNNPRLNATHISGHKGAVRLVYEPFVTPAVQ